MDLKKSLVNLPLLWCFQREGGCYKLERSLYHVWLWAQELPQKWLSITPYELYYKELSISVPNINFSDFILISSPIFDIIPFYHILSSNFFWISSYQIRILVWIWISSHHIEIISRLPWPLIGQTPNMGEPMSSSKKFM